MASWSELTTTYVSTQRIDVATWNALAGYSGNLQYLKDTLDTYSTQQYYTIGFRTSWSFINVASVVPEVPTYFSVDTDLYIDEKPDDVDNQFFNEDDLSTIKMQNTGIYLLTAHYNPISAWNSGEGLKQSQQFYFGNEITDEVISKSGFGTSVSGSLTSWVQASPTPVHNFFIGRISENTVISPRIMIDRDTHSTRTIATFNGSNTSFIDNQSTIAAKSPYVASLFLNSVNLDVTAPPVVFAINGNKKLSINPLDRTEYFQGTSTSGKIGNNPTAFSENDNVVFANYYNTQLSSLPEPLDFVQTTKYYSNSWLGTIDNTYNLGYTFPSKLGVTTPKSVLTHAVDNAFYRVYPYYFMFAFKSFDIFNSMPANTEQNLLSLEQINTSNYIEFDVTLNNEYMGTPLQLTIFHDGTNIKLILRMYANVTIVSFDSLPASERMLFGLRVSQTINQTDVYWPTLYINNTEIASISSWAPNLTTYTLDEKEDNPFPGGASKIWNRITFGGVDYYSVKGNPANNANYSAFYFIGNYKLSDTSLDEGLYVEKEKQYLWNNIPRLFSFTTPHYSFIVTTETAGIIVGSWTFGTPLGLV